MIYINTLKALLSVIYLNAKTKLNSVFEKFFFQTKIECSTRDFSLRKLLGGIRGNGPLIGLHIKNKKIIRYIYKHHIYNITNTIIMKTREEKLSLIRETLNKHLSKAAEELEQEDILLLFGTLDSENTLKEKVLSTTLLVVDKETVNIGEFEVEGNTYPLRDRLLYSKPDSNTQHSNFYFTK